MKTIIVSILGLLGLAGCRSDQDSMVAGKFGEPFTLGISQEALVTQQSPADSLIVVVESITESRCPEGATCIWVGNVRVELSLSKDTDNQDLTLCIGECHLEGEEYQGFIEQDTASVTLGSQPYEVILKDVIPHPQVDRPVGQQEAVLEINSK